jgi:hypothetical protein
MPKMCSTYLSGSKISKSRQTSLLSKPLQNNQKEQGKRQVMVADENTDSKAFF